MVDLIALESLGRVLLDLGPKASKSQILQLLVATHSKVRLREPVQPEDLYWLDYQSNKLMMFRSKCLFLKKYPGRMMPRLRALPPSDVAILLNLLEKMRWQTVLEPYEREAVF